MNDSRAGVIRNARLLDARRQQAEHADILFQAGMILEVGPPGLAAPADAVVVDASDRLIVPGLVNAHTHGHGTLAKGLVADRAPLEVFLAGMTALGGKRSDEDKYLAATLSAVELVRKGSTACFDLFGEFPLPTREGVHAVARAYADVGIRAVVAPMMADRTLYQALPGLLESLPTDYRETVARIQAAPYEASVEACRAIVQDWPVDHNQVRPALGPTIPLHCSDEFLLACNQLARETGIGLQTHLAESKSQAVLGLKRYGKTLTAHLDSLGLLGPHMSAAHAIWVDADDVSRLADAGASAVHNPLSNLRLGSGLAPVRMMLDRGLNVGIGTDAANTSDTQNMFEATRLASYLSRIQLTDHHRWVGADEALHMATQGSARALGLGDRIGRIEAGACADFVFLRLDRVEYWPLNNPLLQVVNGESGAAIDSVMIGGRMVLDNGRMLTVDETRLRADTERAMERIVAANSQALDFARGVQQYVGAFCIGNLNSPYHAERRADGCGC